MLTREEKVKLKQLINDYVQAELYVGVLGRQGDDVKEAVHEAAAKLEVVFTHIDREL